jgi:hypothetical protein
VSLWRPPSEALPVESKQKLTDGDARWKIPECWRDESHESHRKKVPIKLDGLSHAIKCVGF